MLPLQLPVLLARQLQFHAAQPVAQRDGKGLLGCKVLERACAFDHHFNLVAVSEPELAQRILAAEVDEGDAPLVENSLEAHVDAVHGLGSLGFNVWGFSHGDSVALERAA